MEIRQDSQLRRDQLKMLEVLKFFAGICEENNITWWLDSGTLLGAARHKGFIPWDDDMDVMVARKDYARLQRILMNLGDDCPFAYQYCSCFYKHPIYKHSIYPLSTLSFEKQFSKKSEFEL